MSRVYLFADFGRGPRVYFRGTSHPMNETRDRAYMPSSVVQAILSGSSTARRWWLVECENAEAGRSIIAAQGVAERFAGPPMLGFGPVRAVIEGSSARILDSGVSTLLAAAGG